MKLSQIKKLLEPWIRKIVKDEMSKGTDLEAGLNRGLKAMDLLKNSNYINKLKNLFGDDDDLELIP